MPMQQNNFGPYYFVPCDDCMKLLIYIFEGCILKSDKLTAMLYKTFTEYIKLMNISFNILQNNRLEMSHTFVLAHKIAGNTF
jgi:hypothetical protein